MRDPIIDLALARYDFVRLGDHASAAKLLEAAYDAWNENALNERDYVAEVQGIQRWLARLAAEEWEPSEQIWLPGGSNYTTDCRRR